MEKAKYFEAIARQHHTDADRIYGVLLDGLQIGFFRKTASGGLVSDGPYDISEIAIRRLIQIADSTRKKALTSENLIKDLGAGSGLTGELVRAFWDALCHRKDVRTDMFYKEWSRLFGQVSAYEDGTGAFLKEAQRYGIELRAEQYGEFIFTLHTVYAVYIKHIALMILESRRKGEYLTAREWFRGCSLRSISEKIEDGDIFRNLGIVNFLEGDFFCWYVLEWTDQVESAVGRLITDVLEQYEPSTGELKPEILHDLLKELYQGLMSREMRHDLGEYYTPDWLAEYTIQESGYQTGDKILDPCCGSGTFLVLLINRTLAELKGACSDREIVEHITSHICGIDLNPLAVIASRTNYLIAIEPFLEAVESIEIPVYLSDAIFSPKREGNFYVYHIDTEDGRIQLSLPVKLFQTNIFTRVFDHIEELVRQTSSGSGNGVTAEDAVSVLYQWKEYGLSDEDIEGLISLYMQIHALELKNWDGIWCRIVKNHFSTVMLRDFDIVIGNPPWLKWSALPDAYRNTIKAFCQDYGLFSSDSFYGGIESDVSTMVLYSSADKWLRFNGTLAMLITRSVFKTESSEGFRKFRIPGNQNIKFKVSEVVDFTEIRPFSDAVNKPALLVLKKGFCDTEYPLTWNVWKKRGGRITEQMTLDQVLMNTEIRKLAAEPVSGCGSPWLTVDSGEMERCKRLRRTSEEKTYYARKGVCTDCNGIYYGKILAETQEYFVFQNDPSLGRKRIRQIEAKLEKELIHPIARGKEIKAFGWQFGGTYGIIPQKSMHGYETEKMLREFPKTLNYFAEYRDILAKRASLTRYLQGDPYYACWNVGEYTFSKYKVCWAEISGHFHACVLTDIDGRAVVPDHKIYFIAVDNEQEADYLCAYLNAPAVEQFVLGYAENTQIGTHVTDYIHIPAFDPADPVHIELAEIADMAAKGQMDIETARKKIDDLIFDGSVMRM